MTAAALKHRFISSAIGFIIAFLFLSGLVFGAGGNSFTTIRETLSAASEIYKIYVPDDFPTIQAALDAATDIYTTAIIVRDGVYVGTGNKDLDFNGKAITLRSENGPADCVIDCEGNGRGFYFHSSETSNSVVNGFRIINGGNVLAGGGINCYDSSPTIVDCIITNNSVSCGGGIYCNGSSPLISNCIISNNSADSNCGGGIQCEIHSSPSINGCTISGNWSSEEGGGIDCFSYSSPIITNCAISGNSTGGSGGGVICYLSSSPIITNCTIEGNSAGNYGGGIFSYMDADPTITNSILWSNDAPTGPQIALGNLSYIASLTVSYSDVQGGQTAVHVGDGSTLGWGTGNIDADPLFVESGSWNDNTWVNGNYHLTEGSPCIDSGTDAGTYTDVDADVRPYDVVGVNDSNPEPFDMGIDEYLTSGACRGIKSDINNDEFINSGDAILALRIAAGLQIGTPPHQADDCERERGDVNCDTFNNSGDAILILRKAAGLISEFPCGM